MRYDAEACRRVVRFWIDIGVNLTHPSFQGDLEAVIDRAFEAGVGGLVLTGADLESVQESALICQNPTHQTRLAFTSGLHPHHAASFSLPLFEALSSFFSHSSCVAVGETGLDYHRLLSPKHTQIHALEAHIEAALRHQKPLFLHERDAFEDFYATLKPYSARLDGAAVVHCFTGEKRALFAYLDLGFSIGITPWFCDSDRGAHLHALVRHIPPSRLMLETDSPYLFPKDLKPAFKSTPPSHLKREQGHFRNEPVFLPHLGAAIAKARGESLEDIRALTCYNAETFFNLFTHDSASQTQD